jgi:phage shock protein PspC (stress-responsive transcriptional regulator)
VLEGRLSSTQERSSSEFARAIIKYILSDVAMVWGGAAIVSEKKFGLPRSIEEVVSLLHGVIVAGVFAGRNQGFDVKIQLMRIKAIITGATGMVGEGVLVECLNHPDVEQVLVINRKPEECRTSSS